MPNTITIRKAFSSGDDAAAARDRLACGSERRPHWLGELLYQITPEPQSGPSGQAVERTRRPFAALQTLV